VRLPLCLLIICILLTLILLASPWNSLQGSISLNLGYIKLTNFIIANEVVFSEVEPLCPRGLLIAYDFTSLDVKDVLMYLENSMRHLKNISPYLGEGMLYLVLGKPENARQVLQTGLSRDKSCLRLITFLGCAYLQSGDKDSAIAQWRNIPHFRNWRIVRGHKLRVDGHWAASNRNYYAAVQVNPSSYLYHMIAQNHMKLGKVSEAVVAYQKAIELGQYHDDNYVTEMSRLELAKLYIDQKDWNGAKFELEAAIAVRPAMAGAYEQLGVIYFEGFNDLQLANSYLQNSLAINPAAAKPYLYLGSFNRRRGEYLVAKRWLMAGLDLPNNKWTPWLHGELGRVYLELNKYDEAIKELRTILDAVPIDKWYLELLGDAYRGAGRLEEAAQSYQKALTLNRENERIRHKLMLLGVLQ